VSDRDYVIIGLLLNSALALIGIFAAGFITATPLAWKMAIVSAGLIYFLYLAQADGWHRNFILTTQACAIVAGVIGFVALLVK
jgi:arginine exporter protein ArgO